MLRKRLIILQLATLFALSLSMQAIAEQSTHHKANASRHNAHERGRYQNYDHHDHQDYFRSSGYGSDGVVAGKIKKVGPYVGDDIPYTKDNVFAE